MNRASSLSSNFSFGIVYALVLILASIPLAPHRLTAQDAEPLAATQEEAAVEARTSDVVALFKGEGEAARIFSEDFLAAIPPEQVAEIIYQISSQFGPIQALESIEDMANYSARITLRFERALGRGTIMLNPDAPHLIEGLVLDEFTALDDSMEKIESELRSLPGQVSLYFGPLDGTAPRLEIEPNASLAVGSAFKLYVLSALARKVETGEARWEDIWRLKRSSFPSGMTHTWPTDTPMTLQSMAILMVSISDNTTSDALIDYLGEAQVVREMIASGHAQPGLNQPFLTTRQMFALKAGEEALLEAYRAASREGKYELLHAIQGKEIAQSDIERAFSNGPAALDIEWFASAHDLRRLLAHMPRDASQTMLDIMAVDPAVGRPVFRQYPQVYFKGGSEPGVLNLTWLLRNAQGWHVLAMTWNNPDDLLDEQRFEELAQRLLSLPG